MDPVTAAIIAAVAAGVGAGATEVGKSLLVDSYQALKGLLVRKTSDQDALPQAVAQLEAQPDSKGRQLVVQEEVERSGVSRDIEVQTAAQQVLEAIKVQPDGDRVLQQVIGSSYVAQNQGDGTATVNVTTPPPQPHD